MTMRWRFVVVALLLAVGATLVAPAPASRSAGGSSALVAANQREAPPAPRSTPVVARFATLNLPGHATGKHARLLPQPRRTHAALRFLHQHGMEVVALQELSSRSRAIIARHPAWRVVTARPNTVRGAHRIGNAVAYRSERWKAVDTRSVRVAVAGRPRGLNLAVVTLERRGTSARVAVIATHHPWRGERGAAATQRRMRSVEIAVAERLRRTRGLPVVIAGDVNDPGAAATYRRHGYRTGVRHIVDLVAGKGVGFSSGYARVRGVQGRFTDHALPSVRVHLRR